jgi:hypothetical protein
MKKLLMFFGILLMALLPCVAIGQGVQPLYPAMPPQAPPGPGMPGVGPWAPYPGGPMGTANRQLYPDERWIIAPYVRAGYQWLEFHANFPGPSVPIVDSNRVFDSMDLDLVDNNFWIGFVGLELQPIQDWVLYGELGGNIATNVRFNMNASGRGTAAAQPFLIDAFGNVVPGQNLDANLVSPWQWTGKNFQWWMAEGGIAWWVNSLYALEIGFRTEHVDFKLTDPRNATHRIDLDNNDPIPPYPGREIVCTRI